MAYYFPVPVNSSKIKNGEPAGKDEVTRETIKGEDERVMDGIWRLCNWPL